MVNVQREVKMGLVKDNIKDLGSETLYFVINALNQMDIDPIRNEILYNILPLRA